MEDEVEELLGACRCWTPGGEVELAARSAPRRSSRRLPRIFFIFPGVFSKPSRSSTCLPEDRLLR